MVRGTWKRILLVGSASIGLPAILLVGAAEHKPGWYRPANLDEPALMRARADSANTIDWVSGRMVGARPFDFVLAHGSLNDWLFALLHHRSDLRDRLPQHIDAPAIAFSEDEILVGCLHDTGRWRAVLSMAIRVTVSESALDVAIVRAYLGSIPLPDSMFQSLVIQPLIDGSVGRYPSLGEGRWRLADAAELRLDSRGGAAVRIENRFVWPNGKRPFRIGGIHLVPGEIHMRIEPLP